jgi:hypothetical protein
MRIRVDGRATRSIPTNVVLAAWPRDANARQASTRAPAPVLGRCRNPGHRACTGSSLASRERSDVERAAPAEAEAWCVHCRGGPSPRSPTAASVGCQQRQTFECRAGSANRGARTNVGAERVLARTLIRLDRLPSLTGLANGRGRTTWVPNACSAVRLDRGAGSACSSRRRTRTPAEAGRWGLGLGGRWRSSRGRECATNPRAECGPSVPAGTGHEIPRVCAVGRARAAPRPCDRPGPVGCRPLASAAARRAIDRAIGVQASFSCSVCARQSLVEEDANEMS